MSIVIVGGCGHVVLPLGITLANAGLDTVALDINAQKVAQIQGGHMPFLETGTQPLLLKVLAKKHFERPRIRSQFRMQAQSLW